MSASSVTRVLMVTPTYHPLIGGIETVVKELSAHLRDSGLEVEVAHLSPDIKYRSRDMVDDTIAWRLPLKGNRYFGFSPDLKTLSKNFDIIHVHDPQLMAVSLNVFLFCRRKKLILSTHGGYKHTKKNSFFKLLHEFFLIRFMLSPYATVMAISSSDFNFFEKYSNRVSLVHNGVEVSRFADLASTNPANPNLWIYWGRLSRNKRLDVVIDYVKHCVDAGFPIDLKICGPDFDGLHHALAKQISAAGLTSSIQLVGPLDERSLRNEISQRSVFISASEYEGFGLSIIEAMASGRIAIVRDEMPMSGFVHHETDGILLQFDGSERDRGELLKLLRYPEDKILEMSKAAAHHATNYGWETATEKVISIYNG